MLEIRKKFDIYFSLVNDNRKQANVTYRLSDILFMILCGFLCGQSDIESILDMFEERMSFITKHTEMTTLPHQKTINDILKILNPTELSLCLCGIFKNVFNLNIEHYDNQICIDGKTICSTANMKAYNKPLHIVTAFLADESLCIAQKAVDDKSNEIPAVRELIEIMNVKDHVITMDAMHCQKETAELIINNGGDYVLQVKANQKNFYEDIKAMFDDKFMDIKDKDENYETFMVLEQGHGRIERRTCYVLKDTAYFTDYIDSWKGLKKIFAVKREIETDGKKTKEISCYISSKNVSAEQLLTYTRKHWQIESFHWLLDMDLGEDMCMVMDKNVQQILNIFKKQALSMVKRYIKDNGVKRTTIRSMMRKCAFNTERLEAVLSHFSYDVTKL